jgi:hypothetical protein
MGPTDVRINDQIGDYFPNYFDDTAELREPFIGQRRFIFMGKASGRALAGRGHASIPVASADTRKSLHRAWSIPTTFRMPRVLFKQLITL